MVEVNKKKNWGEGWFGKLKFIFTTMSYSIGLGNTWRFPYLVYRHGGATFLVPYFIILLVLAIPMFYLEACLGQFTGMNAIDSFRLLSPITQGLGYAAVFINVIICYYYVLIITYCFYYLFFSMNSELPWSKCPDNEPTCFVNPNLGNCSSQIDYSGVKSPAEIYFYKTVINLTNGISELGGMGYILPLFLLLSWSLTFLALIKGTDWLGKISFVTATVPYILITALVINGALLEGSDLGIEFYVGSFDINNLGNADLWKDGAVQAFFSMSACLGGITTMASFNQFDNNILRDSILVPCMDFFTGFYCGFAIFTMLGYIFLAKCAESFSQVVSQGPELAFVVYPEGMSLMGAGAPAISVFFFLMMLFLGFGSLFPGVETTLNAIISLFNKYIRTNLHIILLRLGFCILNFLLGLFLVTDGGFYILDLLDGAVGGYPLLIIGLFQLIAIGYIYGSRQFVRDIESMTGPKPIFFRNLVIVFWNVICPGVLVAIIVATAITTKASTLPALAQVIYWLVAMSPVYICLGCAIYQIFLSKKKNGSINWRELIQTNPNFYINKNNFENEKNDVKAEEAGHGNKVAPIEMDTVENEQTKNDNRENTDFSSPTKIES